MKQQLTDIVIQLTQLLNSITINTAISGDIYLHLNNTDLIQLNSCAVLIKEDNRKLSCVYCPKLVSDYHYEIDIGTTNRIVLVEYDKQEPTEDNEDWTNKYTTLYLEGEWLIN